MPFVKLPSVGAFEPHAARPSGMACEQSSMTITRRHFLARSTAFGLGFAGLQAAFAQRVFAAGGPKLSAGPFGPLVSDPEGVFDLPAGFRYRVISRMGETMADGLLVPGRPDAMAAFPGADGLTLVVRNHEVSGGVIAESAFGDKGQLFTDAHRERVYDPGAQSGAGPLPGGTTTMVYDTKEHKLVRQFLSLGGTERNCAGGPTPRGTWLSCEEAVSRADQHRAHNHGYCFEVPVTDQPQLNKATPLHAMGRFNHEATSTDPATGIVYLTEDRHEGLLYRFVPTNPDDLLAGGKLQALVIENLPSADTRNWKHRTIEPGTKLKVHWLDFAEHGIDIDSPKDSLRFDGHEQGAARFARGEGMWWGQVGDGAPSAYFACTNGGLAKKGQIWKLTPSADAQGADQLELFVESESAEVIDNADNITVTPFGHLICCEDGSGEQRLVGIDPDGNAYELARNALSESELAGACFSPDGTTLFVNIQHNGLTLAITGPWGKGTIQG